MASFAVDDHVTVVCLVNAHHHYVFSSMNIHFTRHFAAGAFTLCLFLTLSGCFSNNAEYGTQMSADKVSQIKKGVTTRAEVEALLGPPMMVSMMPDEKRMLMYSYTSTQTEAHATAATYIPFVGGVVGGGKAQLQMRTQTLQVMINAKDVVEDYEFSDNTNNTAGASSGFMGMNSTSTTTTAPTGSK